MLGYSTVLGSKAQIRTPPAPIQIDFDLISIEFVATPRFEPDFDILTS